MRHNMVIAKLSLFVAMGTVPSLAQQGMVRTFGGGFQGAGGVAHLHGGHYGAGYHGGFGVYAWHPGYHGARYGVRGGYPYYGFGLGFSIGFGWAPLAYWVPYAYWYGYPWFVPRYHSPSYAPCDYRHQSSTIDAQDCQRSSYVPRTTRSDSRSITRLPKQNPSPGLSDPPETYTLDQSSRITLIGNKSPLRREVKNAIATLRAMPPATRQRWINSGHFESLSHDERALLKQVVDDLRVVNPLHATLANAQ